MIDLQDSRRELLDGRADGFARGCSRGTEVGTEGEVMVSCVFMPIA
jgi:hypothetical protein